jgi:hypothetical protein
MTTKICLLSGSAAPGHAAAAMISRNRAEQRDDMRD